MELLLIDDSETDGLLMRAALSKHAPGEFTVEQAFSLNEGLARLTTTSPAIVVLDLGLPDSDGLDGLQRLVEQAPELPVVLLTGTSDTQLALTAMTLGAQDYLVKGQSDPGSTAQVLRYAIERRRLEQRVRSAELQAERDRRDLDLKLADSQRLEALGVLAGGIAHDFNNLLGVILGNTSLAIELLGPTSEVRDLLEQTQLAAMRSAELTKQMLAYSGKGQFVIKVVDLGAVVQDMSELIGASISKRAELEFAFDPATPRIEADVSQLNQVVLNLLINASEAIGDRAGVISLRTSAVTADGGALEGFQFGADDPPALCAKLEVTDTGSGMDDATRERIFDPFFTTKFTGRGLGLAAIHGIVRAHAGAIRVRSVVGQGTTFEIVLPAADERAAAAPVAARPAAGGAVGGTVLVADDEPSLRRMATVMLERLGFDVICVASGDEALAAYRQQQGTFAFLLLDQMMPGMTGHDVIEALVELGSTTPIILSSGYNSQYLSQNLVRRGVAAFLQKPYEIDQLRDVIARLPQPGKPSASEAQAASG